MLRIIRLLHLYIGVFIAPALLFFAFTGALQTFSLHETTRGSAYKPPRWAVVMGQIHKKQTMNVPVRRPFGPDQGNAHDDAPKPDARAGNAASADSVSHQPGTTSASAAGRPSPDRPNYRSMPLKIFFLLVSIGLAMLSLSGIYMAYKYRRGPVLVTVLLIAGVIVPIVLLYV